MELWYLNFWKCFCHLAGKRIKSTWWTTPLKLPNKAPKKREHRLSPETQASYATHSNSTRQAPSTILPHSFPKSARTRRGLTIKGKQLPHDAPTSALLFPKHAWLPAELRQNHGRHVQVMSPWVWLISTRFQRLTLFLINPGTSICKVIILYMSHFMGFFHFFCLVSSITFDIVSFYNFALEFGKILEIWSLLVLHFAKLSILVLRIAKLSFCVCHTLLVFFSFSAYWRS